jgi:hypothetical protein
MVNDRYPLGIRSDGSFAEHDFIDPSRWNGDHSRKSILAEIHRNQELFQQNLAGMNVFQFGHGSLRTGEG